MPNFRRGRAAIENAQERTKSSGKISNFAPKIFWQNDQEAKYVLFLTPLEEIPEVDLISFIPVKGKKANGDTFSYYEEVIARTEPAINEDNDPLVDKWDAIPRRTCIAVAVELEPKLEQRGGRLKPTGFEVKVSEYKRRIRDEDGDLTDETETVVQPAVGFITQSPKNFFNIVSSYDNNDAPIDETAIKITRIGEGSDTAYQIQGYEEQEIDLSNLIDNVEGISYIKNLDEVVATLEDYEEEDAALELGTALLDQRLEELSDKDRYDKLFEGVDASLDRFGAKNKDKAKKAEKQGEKAEAPKRRTRRAKKQDSNDADKPKQENQEALDKLEVLRTRASKRGK